MPNETDNPARRALVRVLGCKANQYDAQAARETLQASGYRLVNRAPAEVVLLHGCAVTATAAAKFRRQARLWARRCPAAKVVLSGCAVAAPDFHEPLEGCRIIPPGKDWLGKLAASIAAPSPAIPEDSDTFSISGFHGRQRAFLKVQDGCNGRCAYCIVPRLRGPSRSRPAEAIIAEARALTAAGHRELVVCGVSLGSFGKPDDSGALARLLRRLAELPGLLRLRLSSLHPDDLTGNLLAVWRDTPLMAPHIHLPLQSGSDRILAAMRRNYTAAGFRAAVERVYDSLDRPVITTDVITGFPGETREDFHDTRRIIRDLRFSRLHVFPFSARPGTAAAGLPPVNPATAAARAGQLRLEGNELADKVMRAFIGATVRVLVERRSTGATPQRDLQGTSCRYFNVQWRGRAVQGDMAAVRLKSLADGVFRGVPDGE